MIQIEPIPLVEGRTRYEVKLIVPVKWHAEKTDPLAFVSNVSYRVPLGTADLEKDDDGVPWPHDLLQVVLTFLSVGEMREVVVDQSHGSCVTVTASGHYFEFKEL